MIISRIYSNNKHWLLVFFILLGFIAWTGTYWVPADPGYGENAYLLAAQRFVDNFSMAYSPPDEYHFVDGQWVEVHEGVFYPKYPPGMTLFCVAALCLGKIFMLKQASLTVFWVSPIFMVGFLMGCYMLFRMLFEPFYAVLGLTFLAINPIVIFFTNLAYNHAASMFFSVWGMYILLLWWKQGGFLYAHLAGLFLGYLVTIRYDDGLFIIPILVVVALKIFGSEARRVRECIMILATWSIPVVLLFAYNWASMGSLTAYDYTNESTGFSPIHLPFKSYTALHGFNLTGLPMIFPLSFLGALLMVVSNWYIGTLILSWILPSIILHICYYYVPSGELFMGLPAMSHLRFFASILPALILTTLWCLKNLQFPRSRRAHALVYGIYVTLTLTATLSIAIPLLQKQHLERSRIQHLSQDIVRQVPDRSVIIGDQWILSHLQVTCDFQLYDINTFSKEYAKKMGTIHLEDAHPRQAKRRLWLYEFLTNNSETEIIQKANQLMLKAVEQGNRIYFILPDLEVEQVVEKLFPSDLFSKEILLSWASEKRSELQPLGLNLIEVTKLPEFLDD